MLQNSSLEKSKDITEDKEVIPIEKDIESVLAINQKLKTKMSSDSENAKSNEATINEDDIQDQGENSTTLSSLNENSLKSTPEKISKIKTSNLHEYIPK